MSPRLLLVLWLGLGAASAVKYINSFAGPYITYGFRFWECDSEKTMRVFIRLSHFNPIRPRELQTITGNVSWPSPSPVIDDTWWFRTVVDSRSNNEWKENAFIAWFPVAGCSAMRANVPDFFRVVFKKDPKSKEPCVIEPMVYTFEKEKVSWVFPNAPVMPYGHYRIRAWIGRPNLKTAELCLAAEVKVIPKV